MAIQKEVKVIISAVDQFSGAIGVFNSQALGIIKGVGAIATAMVGASMAAGALAVKLGVEVFNSATDFNDAIFNVVAVAQSFGTTTQDISNILDDLTQKFPVTGEQAGASLQLIAQLGYGAAEELRNMSDAANILQVATGADLQTSVMGTLALLNSFNLESDEAGRIINTLAAASFSSAASIEDLGVALRYAAPIASIMGISVEETVAAIAKLRDRGLEASQAGTTLRMALVQLGKETKDKSEVLAKFGLTFADVNPEVHGLSGVIAAFNGQLISGSEAATLFGVRSTAMAHIINMGSKEFGDYTRSITGTSAAIDAYTMKLETWTVVQKNVAGSIDLFKKTLAGDLIPQILHVIGTTEDEGLRGIINWLTETEKNVGAINDVFQDAFGDIKGILADAFSDSFGDVMGLYDFLTRLATALSENFKLLVDWGAMWFKIGTDSLGSAEDIKQALTIVNQSMFLISYTVATLHDAIVFLYNTWVEASNLIFHPLDTITLKIKQVLLAVLELMDKSPFNDLSEEINNMKGDIAQLESGLKPKASYWMDDVVMKFAEVQGKIEGINVPLGDMKDKANIVGIMGENVNSVNELRERMGELAEDTRTSLEKMWDTWSVEEKIDKLSAYIGEDGLKLIDLENIESADDKLKALQEAASKLDTSDMSQRQAIDVLNAAEKAYQDRLDAVAAKKMEVINQLQDYLTIGGVKLVDVSDIKDMDTAISVLRTWKTTIDSSNQSQRQALDALNEYEKQIIQTSEVQLKAGEKWVTDLVQVNGKWVEMKTLVKEAKEEIVELDKPLDEMSDREFSLYTEKFKADLDMIKTKMQETHETVRTKLEWEAKVDIAEAEASAKILAAAFEAASKSVDATSKATSDMFGDLIGLLGSDKWLSSTTKNWLQKQVADQMELQKQALAIQKTLTEAQARNLDARTEKIKNLNKEAMITVDGDGLKPHLEAMMWEVFEAIQIRATEEGLDKLLLGGALSATE